MSIQILNRWTGETIRTVEGDSLSGADLRSANLRDANLSDANLSDADLCSANLRDANLSDANLSDADLCGANLCGANLSGANLSGADLSGADLRSANLDPIRNDLWAVLSSSPKEVPGLLKAIKEGRIDGSTYEGECCCLVGTIANCSNKFYQDLPGLEPDSSRPIERFFLGIKAGDTPENSQFSALAAEWTEDWLNRMTESFSSTTN